MCVPQFMDSSYFADHLMKFLSRYTRTSRWRNGSCRPIVTTLDHPLALLLHLHHHHEKRDRYFCHLLMRTLQTECDVAVPYRLLQDASLLLCSYVMTQWERQGPNEIGTSCIVMGNIYFFMYLQFELLTAGGEWWTVIWKNSLLHEAMLVPAIPNSLFVISAIYVCVCLLYRTYRM